MTLGETVPVPPGPDWEDVLEMYPRELQIEASGEGEGNNRTIQLVEREVFTLWPDQAGALYIGLAANDDPLLIYTYLICKHRVYN
jgi:hypothetical protein